MSLIKYRAFIQIARFGSLSRAAAELGYSQPGISHMIRSLEQEFGVRLFHRGKDSMTLTEEARPLLGYCSQIIKNEDALQETIANMKELRTGRVRIAAIRSALIDLVPDAVKSFSLDYPEIRITIEEMTYKQSLQALRSGSADIAFTSNMPEVPFEFIPLLEEPFCLILSDRHPLAALDEIPAAKVDAASLILPPPGWDDVSEGLSRFLPAGAGHRFSVGSDTALFNMVKRNMGVAVIAGEQTHDLPPHVVAKRFREGLSRTLGIAVPDHSHATPAVREFIRLAAVRI